MRTLLAFLLVCLSAIAQPVSTKVQDLSDAKISTNKTPGYVLTQATNSSGGRYWTNLPSSGSGGGGTNSVIFSGGGGTVNTLPKWTATNAQGDSGITDDGAGGYTLGPSNLATISIKAAGNTNGNGAGLEIYSGDATGGDGGYIYFKAADGNGVDKNGGSVFFSAGAPTGSGVPGTVTFTTLGDYQVTAGNISISSSTNFILSALNSVQPSTSNTLALGTALFPWSSNYIGTKLFLGTNQYTDNGSALLRNGVAIGSGGGGITNSGLTLNTIVMATGTNSIGNGPITITGGTNATFTGQIYVPVGLTASPSYAFTGLTNTGFYAVGGGIRTVLSGTDVSAIDGNNFRLHSSWPLAWGSSGLSTADVFVQREGAAILQLGVDSATPIGQLLKGADGSGSNIAGGNFTNAPGRGTGTGAGGTFFVATSKATTTGSTQNPLTNWFSVDSNGAVGVSNISATATILAGFTGSNTLAGVGIGTGLAMSGTNLTATAAGGVTNYTTLTYTGATNLIGFDAATNGQNFKVTLTNNAYIGGTAATNFPNANDYRTYTLHVIHDSAGLWTLTFDPAKFAWSEGSQPLKTTNGLSYDTYYFHTHAFTNQMLVGAMNQNIK